MSKLSGEICPWRHDHIPLLKFLFARRVACVVFSSSGNTNDSLWKTLAVVLITNLFADSDYPGAGVGTQISNCRNY